MAIDNIILTNKNTGDALYPQTSYNDLTDLPDLITSDDVNVSSSTQPPVLGPIVSSVEAWASKAVKLNGFLEYFFTGTFTVDKKMFSAKWGDPNMILFYIPDNIYSSLNAATQTFAGRIAPYAWSTGFEFRVLNNYVQFDGILNGLNIDLNTLPDQVKISITGTITSL